MKKNELKSNEPGNNDVNNPGDQSNKSQTELGDDENGKSKDEKTFIPLLMMLFIIAIPILVVMGVVQFNKLGEKQEVGSLGENSLIEERFLDELDILREQINSGEWDVASLEKSYKDLVDHYGANREELAELKQLIDERKTEEFIAAEREKTVAQKAKTLITHINDKTHSISELEAEISEFVILYGRERQEVSEILKSLNARKKAEAIASDHEAAERDSVIKSEARKLLVSIMDPESDIKKIELSLSTFVINYGSDREEIPELRRLLEERKSREEEAAKREANIAREAAKINGEISNKLISVEDLKELIQRFVDTYGENRKEVALLQKRLRNRIQMEEEEEEEEEEAAKREAMIANEAAQIKAKTMDKLVTVEELEKTLKAFVENYGESRKEVVELRRLVDDRRQEQIISKTLVELETALMEKDASQIKRIVTATDYADKLIELMTWPGLVYQHQIRSFHRDGDIATVDLAIRHTMEGVPETELSVQYIMIRKGEEWFIKEMNNLTEKE